MCKYIQCLLIIYPDFPSESHEMYYFYQKNKKGDSFKNHLKIKRYIICYVRPWFYPKIGNMNTVCFSMESWPWNPPGHLFLNVSLFNHYTDRMIIVENGY